MIMVLNTSNCNLIASIARRQTKEQSSCSDTTYMSSDVFCQKQGFKLDDI